MFKAAIATPWTGDGSKANVFRPLLEDEYTIQAREDITGQPGANITPSPNEHTVLVIVEEEVLAAIESDPTYSVLWSEEIVEGP